MAIDLSKLKALKLPSKEIEVEILGEIQKLTITAMGDDLSLDIREMRTELELSEVATRKRLLEKCAGLSAEDANLLCERDGSAAAKIISAILDLSDEFDAERLKIREEAKKKQEVEITEVTES